MSNPGSLTMGFAGVNPRHLASFVIASSSNNIEQEELLLLADEYRPTCAISMTNIGSLTMGFAGADPRQRPPIPAGLAAMLCPPAGMVGCNRGLPPPPLTP